MLKRTSMTLVVVGIVVSLNATVWATTLEAYYPFNGNANDESGNGYHGTIHGATVHDDKDNNPDSAYYFDGDDYIEVPSSPDFTTDLIFSADVCMVDLSGTDPDKRIGGYVLNKGVYLVQETYSIGVTESKKPWVRVHVSGTPYIVESPDEIGIGVWTNIRGVYDGSFGGTGLTLYVDNIDKGSIAVSGILQQNSESLYFGQDLGNSLTTWEGCIDEIHITVPEPATLSLLLLSGLALFRKRTR